MSAATRSAAEETSGKGDSPWSPLAIPAFRALWLAAIASNLGTWAHEVGAAWLMTSLTSSPSLVAAVQVAATLPMFALALPSGVAADLFDRRRLLLVAQGWMATSALVLAVTTRLELITPGPTSPSCGPFLTPGGIPS